LKLEPRDIVMDTVLVFLVGVQIYMILDEVTDGNFSRELSVKITKNKARIKELIEIERRVQKDTGSVIFEAITTVEDNDDGGKAPNPFGKS
jgi:hypothetical protein